MFFILFFDTDPTLLLFLLFWDFASTWDDPRLKFKSVTVICLDVV